MRSFDYAQALFDVSISSGKLEKIGYQFEAFVDAIEENEEWLILMELPNFSMTKKMSIVDELFKFDQELRQFLIILIENNNMRLVENIYDEFANLSYQAQKKAHVRVYAAQKLNKKELEDIKVELTPLFDGQEVVLQLIIDKTVLAGYRLVFQGQTIDRTLKHDLEELKTIL